MVSELVSQRAFATEAGTRRFVARHHHGLHADAYADVAGLHVSSVGIGTYLGPLDDTTDAAWVEAVVDAVRRGINVIDTAPNFRCQRAEKAVGRALRQLIDAGEVYRSELLVASGGGFVPFDGAPTPQPAAFFRAATVERGLCCETELVAGCHTLAPDWLAASLQQSLQNLDLQTLDVFWLQNPETQLQWLPRETVLDRLRAAFARLELAADAGQIRVYGVASWSGLRAKPHERDHLALADLVALAESVAGSRHRFRALQVPVNLAMPEAFLLPNQLVRGEWLPVLQAAQRLGLVVFGSAPLHQGKLARHRLAHVPSLPGRDVDLAEMALQFARSLPGIATTLTGMRKPDHVGANARLLRQAKAPLTWLHQAAQANLAAHYATCGT